MRFRTAIIWNGLSQFGQSGITLLSTIILARMLTPDDFGLVGIVWIFVAFSQMIVDSEMGGSLLRKKVVDSTDYSTLFWYNIAVSVVIYALFFIAAPFISDFYSKPQLTAVIRVMCLSIVIHAFRVVQFIMILRELKFKVYALINVGCGVVSLLSAVVIAKAGYGYWALVWQQIIMAGLIVISMSCCNRFVPAFTFSRSSFSYQFKFGIGLLGSNIVTTIANNIATNIIAKIGTLQTTGYYTQVNRITVFFQNAMGAIFNQSIYPLMAKLESKELIRKKYRKILLYLLLLLGMMTILIECSTPFIIKIILGEEWMPVSGMFRILILSVLPACLQVPGRNIMKVLGTTHIVMYTDSAIAIILLGFMLGGIFLGVTFILWGIVAAQVIGAVIWLTITSRILKKSATLKIAP